MPGIVEESVTAAPLSQIPRQIPHTVPHLPQRAIQDDVHLKAQPLKGCLHIHRIIRRVPQRRLRGVRRVPDNQRVLLLRLKTRSQAEGQQQQQPQPQTSSIVGFHLNLLL
jgi:hypothetical protein